MDRQRRYRAFLSYSHADRRAARWMHRALETYRAPPRLVRRDGAPVERTLRPIFRDRDELAASSDLGGTIRDALDQSDALILLCSPASARSRWVNQEVAHFLAGHDPSQVLCVIAGTTPADATVLDVLPPALKAVLPGGDEPLAADLRKGGDGARLARLKLAARLLDVRLDQLVQRDARRRLGVMGIITTAAIILAVVMGGLTVATLRSRQIAREQRDETEALVAYMLGDLRQQLEPVGRLDVLDGVGGRVLAYYAKARTERLDDRALAQRAKAQTLMGTVREQRGDLAGARAAFDQAAATTHALAQRDPRNGDRLFDEAQNVYWLAYIDWRRGDAAKAERGFQRYGELAQALVALDGSRADWRLEVAYAKSNLGTLLFEQGREEDALVAFRAALTAFEAERARAPGDPDRVVDTADAHAWVADTLIKLGRPREAYPERAGGAALLADASAKAADDKPLAQANFTVQLALARLELDLGRLDQARARSDKALTGLRGLVALDPTNVRWREYMLIGELDAVDLALWSGDLALARSRHARAADTLAGLRAGQGDEAWRADKDGRLAQQAILLSRLTGDRPGERQRAVALIARLGRTPGSHDVEADRSALLGFAQLAAGQPAQAVSTLSARRESLPPASLDVLARADFALGRHEPAETIVRSLRDHGYAHPGFLAFWRNSSLGSAVNREG